MDVLTIFIDYDNLLPSKKRLLDVVRSVLQRYAAIEVNFCECHVRVYGGWYEGNSMSRLAQEVSVEIREDFPASIRSLSGTFYQVTAELAVSLVEDPRRHLLNTYRKKGFPKNVRIVDKQEIGCMSAQCPLPGAKMLLRKGRCIQSECSISCSDVVYRHEQKIVDAMLTCDVLYVGRQNTPIVLVSGDDDFLPAVRSVTLRGCRLTLVRPKPRAASVADEFAHPGMDEMVL